MTARSNQQRGPREAARPGAVATPARTRHAANADVWALQRSLGNRGLAELLRDETARVAPQLLRDETARAAPRPGVGWTVQRVVASTPDEQVRLDQLQQRINSIYGPMTKSRARYDSDRWVDELAAALAPRLERWTDVAELTEGLVGKSPAAARPVIDLFLRQPVSRADPRAADEIDRPRDEEREKESEVGHVERDPTGLAATTLPEHDPAGPDEPAGLGGTPRSRSSDARLNAFAFIRQAVDLIAQLSHIERCGWPDAATPVRVVAWALTRAHQAVLGFTGALETWTQSGELDPSREHDALVARSAELFECLRAVNAATSNMLKGLREWLEDTARAEILARKHDLLGALLLLETFTLGVATGLGWVSLFVFPPAALAALALALGTVAVTKVIRWWVVPTLTEDHIRRYGGRPREEPPGGLTQMGWGVEGVSQGVNMLGMTAKLSSTMGFALGTPLAIGGTGLNAYNYMCTVAAASPSLQVRPLTKAGHRNLRGALDRVFAPADETHPFPMALIPTGLLVLTGEDRQTLVGWDGRVTVVKKPSASRK